MRLPAALMVLAAAVTWSPAARSWTCFEEPAAFVLPLPNVPAPTNARPVVRLPLRDAESECPHPVCAEDVERVVLIEAPRSRRTAAEVSTAVTSATSGRTKTFYLAPTAVLSRETRYELRAVIAGKGPVPVSKLLGSFRTGSSDDRKAPLAGSFDAPVLHLLPRLPKGVIVLSAGPEQTETFVTLFGTRASDDQASEPGLMYAVWSAPAGTPIDYAEPPRGLFRPEPLFVSPNPRELWNLGAESLCSVSSFDFPTEGRLTLGIRPVDLAGNMGASSELEIMLSTPGRTKIPKPAPPAKKRK